MQLNAEDGGNRKFIMIQLDEKADNEARKAGYNTIDQIARERIQKAAANIKTDKQLDLGFKHFICKESPIETIDKIEKFDPSKEAQGDLFGDMVNAFGEEAILQTWLIADGYEFNQTPEVKKFAGYNAYYIDGSLYIINEGWSSQQTKELLNLVGTNKLRLNHIRIYGYSLGMESLRELKINVSQSLKDVKFELRY
jgi:adenine-specific DNA-methyltransferase